MKLLAGSWGRSKEVTVIIAILLFGFMIDFTKVRKQNEKMIEQNEKMISLLEELAKRGKE
jgi:hypothetical protein